MGEAMGGRIEGRRGARGGAQQGDTQRYSGWTSLPRGLRQTRRTNVWEREGGGGGGGVGKGETDTARWSAGGNVGWHSAQGGPATHRHMDPLWSPSWLHMARDMRASREAMALATASSASKWLLNRSNSRRMESAMATARRSSAWQRARKGQGTCSSSEGARGGAPKRDWIAAGIRPRAETGRRQR